MEHQKTPQIAKATQQATQSAAKPKVLTAPHPVHPLNHLHQTFGNRAVGNLIQAKLRIGQPGDRYEREADRVADQVMRMPAPAVQRQESEQPEEEEEGKESSIQPKLVYSSAPALQRQEATEEEEEEEPTEGTVQPKRISSTPLTLQRQEAPEEEEEEPDEGAIQPKLVSPALLTLQRQEAPKEEEEELTEGSIQPKLISSACPTLQRQEAPEEEEEEESGAGTIQPKSVSSHTPTLSPSKRTCTQNPFGNPVIGRFIQGKLKIDQPGDRYEREADQVADMAMRMPGAETAKSEVVQHREEKPHEEEHQVRCKPLGQQITPLIQRQFEQERGNVQAKSTGRQSAQVAPVLQAKINSMKGGGQPLPRSTLNFFEPRFGRDFSGVRIHADSIAAETTKATRARAFTVGKDIVFGAGQYDPENITGRRLLTHELVHVVQQNQVNGRRLSVHNNLKDTPASSPTLQSPLQIAKKPLPHSKRRRSVAVSHVTIYLKSHFIDFPIEIESR